MDHFRAEQVNHWIPGRNEVSVDQDDFTVGAHILFNGKVAAFGAKSTITATVTDMHKLSGQTILLPDMEEPNADEELGEQTSIVEIPNELSRHRVPHARMAVIDVTQ